MKRLLISILLCAMPVAAQQYIIGTVTITNAAGTVDGETITVNGNTRTFTWASNIVNTATQIAATNTPALAATNLYNQIADSPYAGMSLSWYSTNAILLTTYVGGNLAVTLSSGWGTVTYSTNTLTPMYVVRVPTSSEPKPGLGTNIMSLLATSLNSSTNAIAPGVPATSSLTGTNETRPLIHTNVLNYFGGQQYQAGTNLLYLDDSIRLAFSPFSSLVALTPALVGLYDSTNNALLIQGAANNVQLGNATQSIYCPAPSNRFDGVITAQAFNTFSGIQSGNGSGLSNVVASSLVPSPILTNQVGIAGDLALQSVAITTLANGANADVAVGTNSFAKVSGPSGAFSIVGIAGAARDGKTLIVLNQTGHDMTIANESGLEATSANRITCLTGSDKTLTGNSAATLIYNSSTSRWVCLSYTQ